jgi:hypothetical protein
MTGQEEAASMSLSPPLLHRDPWIQEINLPLKLSSPKSDHHIEGLCSCVCRSLDKRHAKTTDDEDAVDTDTLYATYGRPASICPRKLTAPHLATKYLAENDQGEQGSQLPLPHAFFLPTMQLWEPLIFGDPPGPWAGQLLALHFADFLFLSPRRCCFCEMQHCLDS